MHILFLTQIIPYPPDAGPRVKTWHVLRYLAARGHQVTLASFIRPEEEAHLPALRKVCTAVHTVPIRRSRLADIKYWLRSHLSGRPFLIERDDLFAMHTLVQRLVDGHRVDVIHTDQLTMAQFAFPYCAPDGPGRRSLGEASRRLFLVFDAHNAVWTIVERIRQSAMQLLRPLAALEARRIKNYEGQIVRHFDHILAVSEPDREALLEAAAASAAPGSSHAVSSLAPVTVVPIAVDTRELQPASRQPLSNNILTLGTLHYPPNADGIRWFARHVFPLVRQQVPQATLTIVGKNPPPDFIRLAEQDPQAIRVTGYVPDLNPYMEQAAIMVVAVRAGGGMRVRLLEAFARAMPVVTTTVGLEGIQAEPGEQVLVADSVQAFAQDVVRLLQDPALQARLAANGRRLAETCYDWQVVLRKMDEVYSAKEKDRDPENVQYA